MNKEILTVDLSPTFDFQYIQNDNHEYTYLLLDENNRALHTPFMCKDYIQDIFYSEISGKSANIWGIHWKKGMMNINRENFRVALNWGVEELKDYVDSLQKFVRVFDNALGIPESTVYETTDPHTIVVEFNKAWSENGPLLSAYMTLLRMYGLYDGQDVAKYIESLLHVNIEEEEEYPVFMYPELSHMNLLVPRYLALLQGKKPEHDWNDFPNVNYAHDTGIIGFKKFPQVQLQKGA